MPEKIAPAEYVHPGKNSKENLTGHYDPQAVTEKRVGEKIMPIYPDSVYTEKENRVEVERQMTVGKQTIIVRSYFLSETAGTPTQKLLGIIDSDAKKV